MRAAFVATAGAAVLIASCGGETIRSPTLAGSRLTYRIEEMPPVEGVTRVWPRGINSSGYIVGSYPAPDVTSGSTLRPFLYDPVSGATQRIGTAPGVAFGVNDQLQLALTMELAYTEGVRWHGGVGTGIGTLSVATAFSYADAINSGGWLVGWSASASGMQHAVIWNGSSLRDISPAATYPTAATSVNAYGTAVGVLYARDGLIHAVAFAPEGVKDLGTLGGESWAMSINDAGRIVGYSDLTGSGEHGFVYDLPSGPMRDVSPARRSMLRAVNSAGDAVGAFLGSIPDSPEDRAMLWRGGELLDLTEELGDPDWILFYADVINDSGVIVGRGEHKGLPRAFILTQR